MIWRSVSIYRYKTQRPVRRHTLRLSAVKSVQVTVHTLFQVESVDDDGSSDPPSCWPCTKILDIGDSATPPVAPARIRFLSVPPFGIEETEAGGDGFFLRDEEEATGAVESNVGWTVPPGWEVAVANLEVPTLQFPPLGTRGVWGSDVNFEDITPSNFTERRRLSMSSEIQGAEEAHQL